jgi:DNA-binding transcriptional MerR regulator
MKNEEIAAFALRNLPSQTLDLTLELVPAFILTKVEKNSMKNESYRPGQLARITGVSADTLRHYERKGLLKSRRSPNGYREYPPHSVNRVTLIRNALAIGFGLDDLALILKIRDAGGAPCQKVHAMATAKLEELETLLLEITKLRDDLRELLKDWNRRLESVDNNEPAGLLESLFVEKFGDGQTPLPMNSLLRTRKLHKEKK